MKNILQGKKILILGAGTWLVPYIIKANELGLLTYVTDWSKKAEGRHYAHVFKVIDLKDKKRTLDFAKKNKVDAIFTSADIGVQTASFVAKKLGLKYHSEELAINATNKKAMRHKAQEIGLSVPQYFATNSLEKARLASKKIGYPVVIKPVDNFSSRGVSVVFNEDGLNNVFHESLSASFEGNILIEEFMTGTEGSVEALVQNGEVFIMGVCDKEKSELPYRYDIQLNYPGNYTPTQYKNIELFIETLVKGFDINDGIIHVEIMVKDDSVKLIEFGIRGCGSKVITHLMPNMLGFDVLKFLISNSFGIEQEVSFVKNRYGVLKFIMLEKGVIKSIEGKEEILEMSGVVGFDIERKAGDIIAETKDGRNRPGYLLAVENSITELIQTIEKASSKINVIYK